MAPAAKNKEKTESVKPVNYTLYNQKISFDFLKAHLWSAADILRGSLDPADYRQPVMTLLFLKRLNDTFGKQTYTGAHFKEAIQHSIDKGATYSIIVYDTQENLPQKTMFARERGVLVAVADIQSGTWKMVRDIFEVLQKEVTSKRSTVNEISIKVIQEVATDIGALLKYTSNIKGKTAKIRSFADKIDEDSDEIKSAVLNYQKKLKDAVWGMENAK